MKMAKLLLSVCLLLVFLCACGAVKEVTEEQMAADLFSDDAFYEFRYINPMEIKKLEVEKRQTNVEDKVDTVWVQVAAQSDSAAGIMRYVMTYGLYNDGWHLDEVEENRAEAWSFTPTKGPSEELIAQWLPDGVEIIDDTLWLEDGQENITYSYTQSNSYCNIARKECLTFTFDNTNMGLWNMFNTVTLSEDTIWDVCGQYALYENGVKTDKTATIYEFSPNRVVWQFDSQPDYRREYNLVDVSSCSVNDYYMNYAGYPSDRDYALRYGYTFTINNINWSDIRYASAFHFANIFIGENHIYAMDDEEARNNAERKIPYTLRYELIPISESF